jgi:hypothetical protein
MYLVEETRPKLARKSCMAEYRGPIDGRRSSLTVRYFNLNFNFNRVVANNVIEFHVGDAVGSNYGSASR